MNIVWKHFLLECLPGTEPWPSSWQGNTAQTDGPIRSPDSQHCGRLSCDFTDNMTAWRAPPLRRCHAKCIPTENPPCAHLAQQTAASLIKSDFIHRDTRVQSLLATQAARFRRLIRVHT